ncbi:RNA recognition motif domain-containing protein [Thermodesulfobacteriota bacterium]
MKIYVGNLPNGITEEDLLKTFKSFGKIDTVDIIKDRYSDRSKGFGFAETPSKDETQSESDELNDKKFK